MPLMWRSEELVLSTMRVLSSDSGVRLDGKYVGLMSLYDLSFQCVWVFSLHLCLVPVEARENSQIPGLRFQRLVSLYIGRGDQICDLCYSS